MKVLEKSRIKDKKDVERISREIKILKQLQQKKFRPPLHSNMGRKGPKVLPNPFFVLTGEQNPKSTKASKIPVTT